MLILDINPADKAGLNNFECTQYRVLLGTCGAVRVGETGAAVDVARSLHVDPDHYAQ